MPKPTFYEFFAGGGMARDGRNLDALGKDGWRTCVVWECDLKDEDALRERLRDFISAN